VRKARGPTPPRNGAGVHARGRGGGVRRNRTLKHTAAPRSGDGTLCTPVARARARNTVVALLMHIKGRPLSRVILKRMAHEYEQTKNRAWSLVRTTAFYLVLGILLLTWQSLPGHAFPATQATGPAFTSDRLVAPVQSPGDPGDWCPPGMSLCDASVCCKKGWRCCRGGCCPPQFRWACDTEGKCYRSKQAALRDGCPEYAVSICIKPRWAD
jgi:hypothetical protein